MFLLYCALAHITPPCEVCAVYSCMAAHQTFRVQCSPGYVARGLCAGLAVRQEQCVTSLESWKQELHTLHNHSKLAFDSRT